MKGLVIKWSLGLLIFSLLLMAPGRGVAQVQESDLTGFWFNEEKDAKIQIYKAKDQYYYGKITWLKEPNRNGTPKLDDKNIEKSLRNRPIMGLHILRAFKYKGNNTFGGGKIYDPKNGKTYDCNITQKGKNELVIRGYIGISLIGRNTVWKRAN